MKRIILSLLSLFLLSITNTYAQSTTLVGRVTEAGTRQPLETAMVTLLKGTEGTLTDYALTDANGRFRLKVPLVGTWQISVSYMGYKTQTRSLTTSQKSIEFIMEQEAFALKEVQIRPGRVWARQDTLKYDLTRFISSKDTHVSDLLKKLPGIHVEDNGLIKYNGKAISNFYVEGLDVTGGRYNQINNNLRADAVKEAEVIEHHQPVKSLQGKVFTDDVALNLKLKPEARSQWILNALAGTGYGDKWLYTAAFNALQLDKNTQTVYAYKSNNTGTDLSSEQQELSAGNMYNRVTDNGAPQFLSIPSLLAPLDKKRLLYNDTHTFAANRLYKLNDEKQLRFLLGYTHDRTTQQQGSNETYYFAQDTLSMVNNQNLRLRTDRMEGELNFESNTGSHYTRNRLILAGAWNDGLSEITGDQTLTQHVRHSQLDVKNLFSQLHNCETYTWGIRSLLRYSTLPASLQIADKKEKMNVQNAYTDNSLYWLRKRNGLGLQLTTGIQGELSSITQRELSVATQEHRYTANGYLLYTTPQLEWERNAFRTTASATLQWQQLPAQSFAQFRVNPTLYLCYRLSSRWELSLTGKLTKSVGGLTELYPQLYQQNYRTRIQNSGIVPETTQQLYSLYSEYKNTMQEFFWTFSLAYAHHLNNLLTDKEVSNGQFLISSRSYHNTAESYTLNTLLSKGVFDWHLKTSLELTLNRNEGEQSNRGVVQTYRYDYLQCTPRLIWSPSSFFEADYKATMGYSSSRISSPSHIGGNTHLDNNTRLDPLWNISQRMTLNFGLKKMEIQLSGEHYYNDLSSTQHLNTFLADASLIYKTGKWRLTASATNLLNQQQYRHTVYSDIQSYASWVGIRPREYLCTAQYRF